MPSPFPGMDPYLEDPVLWPDFHATFLLAVGTQLNRKLPKRHVARLGRHADEGDLVEPPRLLGKPTAPAAVMQPAIETRGKPFLKIIDARGKRVLTIIELLSPANKSPGRGQEHYLAKRQEYLRGRVNLVEIDLLCAGERPPLESARPPADYYIIVSRPADYPRAGIWPIGVRDPLPTVPVPLDLDMEPVPLELRECLDRAYHEGRFGEEIDYRQPPTPPLPEAEAAWAGEQVRRMLHLES